MAFKIYKLNNYLIVEDTVENKQYQGLAKNVLVYKDLLSEEVYNFEGITQEGLNGIAVSNMIDENNNPFSNEQAFINFYTVNTGNFNVGGGTPQTLDEVTTVGNNTLNTISVGNIGIGITSPIEKFVVKNSDSGTNNVIIGAFKTFAGTTVVSINAVGNIQANNYITALNGFSTNGGLFSPSGYLGFNVGAGENHWNATRNIRYTGGIVITDATELTPKSYVDGQITAATQKVYSTQVGTEHTLVLSDANNNITFTSNSNKTVTIPLDATVAFPIKTKIKLITTTTSNVKLTVVPTVGVTLEAPFGLEVYFASNIYLEKISVNTWRVEASPLVEASGTLFAKQRITTDGGFYTTNNYVIGPNGGIQTPDNYINFKIDTGYEWWNTNKPIRDNSGVALTHTNQVVRKSDLDLKYNKADIIVGDVSDNGGIFMPTTYLIDFSALGIMASTNYILNPSPTNSDASVLFASGWWIDSKTTTTCVINFNIGYSTLIEFDYQVALKT